MNKKKFLDEIQSLADEAEWESEKKQSAARAVPEEERAPLGAPKIAGTEKPPPGSSSPESVKTPHEGHRARVKKSVSMDPDFTTFSDHEVLEYLLFNTIPRADVNELAHHLIDTFGSFSGVLNANVNELKQISYFCASAGRTFNIGEDTARSLTSILPAARKAEMSRLRNNAVLHNTAAAVNYLQPFFMNRNAEHIYLACLNGSGRVLSVDLITVGDTNFSTVEVKKIIETACRHKASKVIIAHNHPAGTLEPSQDDLDVTARLVISLMSMNVVVLDHLIFTSQNYYSFFANRGFEAIYAYVDSIFKTSLVQEIRLKPKNYRAGVYPAGGDGEVYEKGVSPGGCALGGDMPYALGHPDPRRLFRIIKK